MREGVLGALDFLYTLGINRQSNRASPAGPTKQRLLSLKFAISSL